MASSVFIPSSPDFEVLHFKQRQGENLKDAWFRMLESYRSCNIEGDFKILLRNFYVGLTLPHRQLLDFASKGSFIDIDPGFAYEIIEGIVGVLPLWKGSSLTQEETQILEKLCELQKNVEPLKSIGGNINRMNNLITLCNKQLDALDQRITEHNSIKNLLTKDGNP